MNEQNANTVKGTIVNDGSFFCMFITDSVFKLFLLSGLLWGGILLLAFEHLWHGEVTLFAPFLTAMSNPEDKAVMLHEMATVGVTMSAVVTSVWGIAVAVVSAKFKKRAKTAAQEG